MDCLNEVSLNTFVNFVHLFPDNLFELSLGVKWDKFFEDKKEDLIYREEVE